MINQTKNAWESSFVNSEIVAATESR